LGRSKKSATQIQANGNARKLTRSQLQERAADEQRQLPQAQAAELAKINRLIDEALNGCAKGARIRGQKNMAFASLNALLRARRILLETKFPTGEAGPEHVSPLAALDEFLKGKKVN
jgi:hypothetical protein